MGCGMSTQRPAKRDLKYYKLDLDEARMKRAAYQAQRPRGPVRPKSHYAPVPHPTAPYLGESWNNKKTRRRRYV